MVHVHVHVQIHVLVGTTILLYKTVAYINSLLLALYNKKKKDIVFPVRNKDTF